MPRQKPWMLHWEDLLTESLRTIRWLILCCFSLSNKHGQTSNVIWLFTTWLLIFQLEVAKKAFNRKACLYINWSFLLKRYNCSQLQNFVSHPKGKCYTGKMLFANASKIIRNWFVTVQPNIFKIIFNLPKWAQERVWM